MSVVLGKNLQIMSGTSGTTPIIAMAKSCTVSIQYNMIEISSSSQSNAEEYIKGRYKWSISANHLVQTGSGINPLSSLLMAGQTYTIRVVCEGTSLQGKVICEQADLTGSVGALMNGQVKLRGTGELT